MMGRALGGPNAGEVLPGAHASRGWLRKMPVPTGVGTAATKAWRFCAAASTVHRSRNCLPFQHERSSVRIIAGVFAKLLSNGIQPDVPGDGIRGDCFAQDVVVIRRLPKFAAIFLLIREPKSH